jgi:hypothetical protein
MRETHEFPEAMAAWRNQPQEETPVNLQNLHQMRTWELFSATRAEIIGSVAAALFFALVMAWRFLGEADRLVQWGCLGVILWAAVTAYRYRRAFRRSLPEPGTMANTGLEHYRAELLRRRNHLRNIWIWHGPLLLAALLSAATVTARLIRSRLWDALPLFLALAIWAFIGIQRRLRQAAEVQEELNELTGASPVGNGKE